MKILALAICAVILTTPAAVSAPIESACMKSGRQSANRLLCGCIQDVADITLSRSDQRAAAKFFRDPHRAQEIRQSDRSSHEAFWKRYRNFGETAEAFCSN